MHGHKNGIPHGHGDTVNPDQKRNKKNTDSEKQQ